MKKLENEKYEFLKSYKDWEDCGFTDKKLEWISLKRQENIEKVSLVETYKLS